MRGIQRSRLIDVHGVNDPRVADADRSFLEVEGRTLWRRFALIRALMIGVWRALKGATWTWGLQKKIEHIGEWFSKNI